MILSLNVSHDGNSIMKMMENLLIIMKDMQYRNMGIINPNNSNSIFLSQLMFEYPFLIFEVKCSLFIEFM